MVRKLNREIRKAVKKILHLPTCMPTNWIYHRNGANIPDLLLSTMQSRTKATTKMKLSEDPISRSIGGRQNPTNEERLQRLGYNTNNRKEEQHRQMEEELERINNGKALVTALRSRHKCSWLWTKRGLTPGNKIRFIQALSGCLPTKVNKTRGNPDRRAMMCTRCRKNEIEDDGHILSRCSYNKDLITKRHNYITNKITKELVKNNPTAWIWMPSTT